MADLNLEERKKIAQEIIAQTCDSVKTLLLQKNNEYNNSVYEPINVFSKSTPHEQMSNRIDDKLKRIANSGEKNIKEDTILDLIGYLILQYGYPEYIKKIIEIEKIKSSVGIGNTAPVGIGKSTL